MTKTTSTLNPTLVKTNHVEIKKHVEKNKELYTKLYNFLKKTKQIISQIKLNPRM